MAIISKSFSFESKSTIDIAFLATGNDWQPDMNIDKSVVEASTLLVDYLVEIIDRATRMICFTSFIFQEGAIIAAIERAAIRGVKIFILCSTTHLRQQKIYDVGERFKSDTFKEMLKTRFQNKVLLRCADDIHAKFILIDPKQPTAKGWLTTFNFTEKASTQNIELAVALEKEEILELFKVFVWHFWEGTTDEQTSIDDFRKVIPANKFRLPKCQSILLTSTKGKVTTIQNYLLSIIQNAQHKIIFSTFGFDLDNEVAKELLQKCKEGLEVIVFTRSRKLSIHNQLSLLVKAGATIYTHELLHAKFMLVDDARGSIFTANMETNGMKRGFEVGLILKDDNITDLKGIIQHWLNTFPYKIATDISVLDISEDFYTLDIKSKLVQNSIREEINRKEKIKPDNSKSLFQSVKDLAQFDHQKYKRLNVEIDIVLKEISKAEVDSIKPLSEGIFSAEQSLKVKKGKQPKRRPILLLQESFDIDDLEQQQQYSNYEIYYLEA